SASLACRLSQFERIGYRQQVEKARQHQQRGPVLVQASIEELMSAVKGQGEQIRAAGEHFGQGPAFEEQYREAVQSLEFGRLGPLQAAVEPGASERRVGGRGKRQTKARTEGQTPQPARSAAKIGKPPRGRAIRIRRAQRP